VNIEEGLPLVLSELQADVSISNLLGGGPLNTLRSLSEFSSPSIFKTNWSFQALDAQVSLGDLLLLKQTLIFAPDIVQYFSQTHSAKAAGFLSPTLLLRKVISTFELVLVGTTLDTTLLIDDLRETPTDPAMLVAGLRVEALFKAIGDATVSSKMRFGLKDGVECFGNCVSNLPFKIVEDAVSGGLTFEDWSTSIMGLSVSGFGASVSALMDGVSGFVGAEVDVDRKLNLFGTDATTSASLIILPNMSVLIGGASASLVLLTDTGGGANQTLTGGGTSGTLDVTWTAENFQPPTPPATTLPPPATSLNFQAGNPNDSLFAVNFNAGSSLNANLTFTRRGYTLKVATQWAPPLGAMPPPTPPFELRTLGIVLEAPLDPITLRIIYGFSAIAQAAIGRFEVEFKF
jgi:hypothetical protein